MSQDKQTEAPLSAEQIMNVMLRISAVRKEQPTVEDIAAELAEGAKKGLDTANLDIRKEPVGYYSERVDQYMSKLEAFGYATRKSPLTLNEEGDKFLQKRVNDMSRHSAAAVGRWVGLLGSTMDQVLGK